MKNTLYQWKEDIQQEQIIEDNNIGLQEDEQVQQITENLQADEAVSDKKAQVRKNMPEGISSFAGKQSLVLNGKYRFLDSKGVKRDATRTTPSSKYMQPVLDSLKDIDELLSKNCDPESGEAIHKAFIKAVLACENYLDNRNPWTDEGKARKQMVRDFYGQIKKESVLFEARVNEIKSREDHSYRDMTWLEVLKDVRTVKYTDGENGVTIDKGGAQASEVYIVKKNGKKQYFKENEKLFKGSYNQLMKQSFLRAKDSPKRTELLTKIKSFIEDYCEQEKNNPLANASSPGRLIESIHSPTDLFRLGLGNSKGDFIKKFMKEHHDLENSLQIAQIRYETAKIEKKGEEIIQKYAEEVATLEKAVEESDYKFIYNEISSMHKALFAAGYGTDTAHISKNEELSKRNVATTRMAKVLGLDHLVAKSEMASVTINGKTMNGIMMEGAEGAGAASVYNIKNKEDNTVTYSPEAFKDLLSLEVFDLICGQCDRHANNYMADFEYRDGVYWVKGIKGIDNDMSFGEWNYNEISARGLRGLNRMKNIEVDGEMTIPYIDYDLAMKIKALTPKMIDNAMADILSKEERKALMSRIKGVKKVIEKQLAYEKKMRRKSQPYNSRFVRSRAGSIEPWKNAMKAYAQHISKNAAEKPEATQDAVEKTTYLDHRLIIDYMKVK